MIIKEVNEGVKVAYAEEGTRLYFGDDELMLNLKKYERDEEVTINICTDDDMILIAGLSKYFVANIIIPARAYEDAEKTTPVPFNMDRVTLCLWALPEIEEVTETVTEEV